MATSSEEVLLIVKKVRQKKQDGALYLMAERIAWAPEGKDRFTISHMYADIKCKSAILSLMYVIFVSNFIRRLLIQSLWGFYYNVKKSTV